MKFKKAFSLLEVLTAITVLMFVMMGTVTMFYQGYKYQRKSKEKLISLHVAQGLIEQYSNWDLLDCFDSAFPGSCGFTNGVVTPAVYNESNQPDCYVGVFNSFEFGGIEFRPELEILDGVENAGSISDQVKRDSVNYWIEKVLILRLTWDSGSTTKTETLSTIVSNDLR